MSETATALVLISLAALGLASLFVVLRTPIRLLNLRVRLEEVEHQVGTIDAQLKKAVRRWGADAKRAGPPATSAEEPEPPPHESEDLPLFAPGVNHRPVSREASDELAEIRRRYRERTGR